MVEVKKIEGFSKCNISDTVNALDLEIIIDALL